MEITQSNSNIITIDETNIDSITAKLIDIGVTQMGADAYADLAIRVTKEYARRALEVGCAQALAESAEWHDIAPLVILHTLGMARQFAEADAG